MTNNLESRINSLKKRVVVGGIAALGMAVGLSGCMSSHRIPVYVPPPPSQYENTCYWMIHDGEEIRCCPNEHTHPTR